MVKAVKAKTLKVVISGSFKATDGEIESFDKVQGIIPRLSTEPAEGEQLSKAEQMIIRRYASIWIARVQKKGPDGKDLDEGKYKRVQKVRQVFIDSIDDNDENPDATLSYVGKNILDMNFEELQDLAAANDLNQVPLYKVNSLQHARRVAWSEYAVKVLGLVEWLDPNAARKQNIYDFRSTGFNPNKHEPIIADGHIRMGGKKREDIEQIIKSVVDKEVKPGDAPNSERSRLTLEQLKAIADSKGVEYHKTIGYEQLHSKVYGKAA